MSQGEANNQAQYAELLNLLYIFRKTSGLPTLNGFGRASVQVETIAASPAPGALPNMPVVIAGKISIFNVVMGQKAWAAGESATINITKNGAGSILTAPIVLNAANNPAPGLVSYVSDLAAPNLAVGDELTITIAYVAGGAPNHPDFSVNLAWA